ncbi:hydantoinase B/oxoprolinase family protein [Gordonia sp. L191]|uniref:hydantoinase B/oxoprolinase family protein n=1 Tax=Gordonia sp. L191 TaxID=2982699 RepID=UPI0024C0B673|nr:hydantoinase B/oxoprolinase family protein [Gordonia sp. L191]WHU46516.1 hydantoinase B/oxoprolinase family protein [Gordonia sp. L191]
MTDLMPVPGSERYNSRPPEMDELAQSVAPSLKLHHLQQDQESVDPLTYEVVRHRIWSITDEMGQTLKRMSGSPGVTEANDFGFAICDELGQEVQVGTYNTGLVASTDLAVYWTLRNHADNPGIEPGDMFLNNDPWVGGGLHQNDATILAPLFWEGELFAWTTASCHLIDVGGPKPGSANLAATDVFSEALPTPPTKVVRDGIIQSDVLGMFTRRSRMPALVELDVRAEIGANRVGHQRLTKLIERYGPATVKAVMKRMMDDAEGRLRNRLSSIPDGDWRATTFIEQSVIGDRDLHKITLHLTKTGDHLTFDFTGTDPQSGMINSPYAGMRAGVVFAMLPVLAGDIPWAAGGIMRCFDLISDEGTINNATFPAAIGWAPISAGWATSNVVAECLGKMLDTAPELRSRVQSVCTGAYDIATLAGIDQRGAPSVGIMFDTMAGGFGALPHRDGTDTGGILPIAMGRAPDVEMSEFLGPYLFLWRREETDSGGAGQFRGGVSISSCLIPHGTPMPMGGSFSGNGKARPDASGLAGGYPGGVQTDLIVRGGDVGSLLAGGTIPQTVEEIGGSVEVIPNRLETVIMLDDVIIIHPSGGGGYGDPILRDPQLVADDVRNRKVSRAAAESLYGVMIDDNGQVNAVATESARIEIRRQRGADQPDIPLRGADETGHTGHDHLNASLTVTTVSGVATLTCRQCGTALGSSEAALADNAKVHELAVRQVTPEAPVPSNYVDIDTMFRALVCPCCGTYFETSVVPTSSVEAVT